MLRSVLFLAALCAANAVQAADTNRFSCSLWTQVVSRALFNNTGTFVTTGPAIFAVPECVDAETGLFGNLFLIAPTKEFNTGKEIDIRLGKRFKAGGLDVEASVANYYFGVGGDLYDTGNGRVRISRTIDAGFGTVQPYGVADYSHSFSFHTNSLGLAAGAVTNSKLNSWPGKPDLSVDIAGWKYTTIVAPSKGPIWSLDVSLGFPVTNKVTIGMRVTQTWGSVASDGRMPEHMVGLFLFTPL